MYSNKKLKKRQLTSSMTDLTPLFRQCVDIVQQEYKTQPTTAKQPYYLNDTFIKETTDFFHVLTNLNQFINETKSSYLAINDDTKLAGSIDDKNKIDEEFNTRSSKCTSD